MSEALATSKSFAIIRPSPALVSLVLRPDSVPFYFGRFFHTYAAKSLLRTGQQARAHGWPLGLRAPIEGVISFSVGSGHVSLRTSLPTLAILLCYRNLEHITLFYPSNRMSSGLSAFFASFAPNLSSIN
jgi:hypothetical protein